jgi:hydrogenase maturation protein HypF
MLPSTPLHYQLFAAGFPALVMTSGNRSSEPIAYRDDEALERLGHIADAFLAHNRPIRTRVDDSVIRVFQGNPLFLRRSRGYVPRAVQLKDHQLPVLAVGAELKGACCLTKGDRAFMSQHIGDLQNIATIESLADTIDHMQKLFEIPPVLVAHDLHPDYLTTRYAQERTGLPNIGVQHHHAHLAACMAENRIDGPAIGVIFDGTGYGPDGTVWGGEFLLGDFSGYRRLGSFHQVMMPGGDAAVNEPRRMALSWLHAAVGDEAFELFPEQLGLAGNPALHLLRQMLARGLNSPLTSSCGRLFDAVASLIGVRGVITYEGQAAIELEALAERSSADRGYLKLTGAPSSPPCWTTLRPRSTGRTWPGVSTGRSPQPHGMCAAGFVRPKE